MSDYPRMLFKPDGATKVVPDPAGRAAAEAEGWVDLTNLPADRSPLGGGYGWSDPAPSATVHLSPEDVVQTTEPEKVAPRKPRKPRKPRAEKEQA